VIKSSDFIKLVHSKEYTSMNDYNKTLKDEISQFRKLGHQFVNKEMSIADFKGKSGGMGVYAQLGGEKLMIRLRIPSGVLSVANLKLVTEFAKQYQLTHIHLTTRQAIQLHDLDVDQVCEIMEVAIDNELYSRGSGGNYPRNVALSPLSGVEPKEAFDVTPYALQVGNYLQERMIEYHLPRKLKIAFSSSDEDSSNSTINDLGFLAVIENGRPYFKLYLAGGLGNNPAIALPFDELVSPEEVLYHVEAITRLFVAEGDYQNKGKARLRYVVMRMGADAFLDCYKRHLTEVKESLILEGIKPILTEETADYSYSDKDDCLILQKQKDRYTVILHPLFGQMPTVTLISLISFLEECEGAEVRLSMTESMYIRNLNLTKAKELLDLTKDVRKKTKVQMSVSCIGVPTCQVGIEQSQALGKSILDVLEVNQIAEDFLPAIHISGCTNSCARHQVNAIGFAGRKKRIDDKVEDVFELHVGGISSREKTEFGRMVGLLKKDDIPQFITELALLLNERKMYFMEYIDENTKEFDLLVNHYLV